VLSIPDVGAVVGAGRLAVMLGSMVVGGVSRGPLGAALTNVGISEEDAQIYVEEYAAVEHWLPRGCPL
jgi:hypothetical protein